MFIAAFISFILSVAAASPNQHHPTLLTVHVDCVETMSGSTKRGEYNALPVNTLQALQVSEREISFASTEEKSEYPRQESGYLLWHWRWEIFTFLLGTGAFITILALLLRFRNKPPPDILLGNNNIQLTAIIAALAQVAQSALLVPISYCIGQLKW